MRRVGGLVLLALLAQPRPASAEADQRLERLVALGRVWGGVWFSHPWFGYQDIDWDRALIEAIPRVRAAGDRRAYAEAVARMLAVIGDPATRVLPEEEAPSSLSIDGPAGAIRWPAPGVLHVLAGEVLATGGFADAREAGKLVAGGAATARAVIVDVRTRHQPADKGDEFRAFMSLLFYGEFERALVTRPVALPASRSLVHSGWRADSGEGGLEYQPLFVTEGAPRVSPRPGGKPLRVVFVADARSTLPRLALALQAAGQAWIVADGGLDDSALVRTRRLPIGEGLTVAVRASELVDEGRMVVLRPDRLVAAGAPGGPDGALAAALQLARASAPPRPRPARGPRLPVGPDWRPNRGYPEMHFPELPYRLLAVCRFWNVIAHLDPYLPLADDWEAALPRYLRRMEEAGDARAYAMVIAEMAASLRDGHAEVGGSPELRDFFGRAPPPVDVQVIEKQVVITRLADPSAAAAGLEVGDPIVRVDGEPVPRRMAKLTPFVPASTPAHLQLRAANRMLRGPDGSKVVLTVRKPTGALVEATLVRSSSYGARAEPPAYKLLDPHVGYVNLVRLQVSEVDAMFEALKGTRAMVLDMRGYPRGTAWAIAPRINVRQARYGAAYERPQTGGPAGDTRLRFLDELPAGDGKPLYRGKTVMLIDERAISQSEHSGLFFRQAAGTTFVGSHTAGADGERTDVVLPGGISVPFTGSEVRHVDGAALQGVGLVPDIEVKPTVAGIRAGRDEVLERALSFLNQRP
jgi:C-terminal processing protease CtpA/Prc